MPSREHNTVVYIYIYMFIISTCDAWVTCLCVYVFLRTDDHLEALWIILDEGLSLHRLGQECFGDQREANTPQHLHHILLSVTHIVLQPAHCCVINLNTNPTKKHG